MEKYIKEPYKDPSKNIYKEPYRGPLENIYGLDGAERQTLRQTGRQHFTTLKC